MTIEEWSGYVKGYKDCLRDLDNILPKHPMSSKNFIDYFIIAMHLLNVKANDMKQCYEICGKFLDCKKDVEQDDLIKKLIKNTFIIKGGT